MYNKLNDYLDEKFKALKFECDDVSSLNERLNQKVIKMDKTSKEWQTAHESIILANQEAISTYET